MLCTFYSVNYICLLSILIALHFLFCQLYLSIVNTYCFALSILSIIFIYSQYLLLFIFYSANYIHLFSILIAVHFLFCQLYSSILNTYCFSFSILSIILCILNTFCFALSIEYSIMFLFSRQLMFALSILSIIVSLYCINCSSLLFLLLAQNDKFFQSIAPQFLFYQFILSLSFLRF